MNDDQQRDTRTVRTDVDPEILEGVDVPEPLPASDPDIQEARVGDVTGYRGSDRVVGRPEHTDLAPRPDEDEMPKEGVPEEPSVPNDALSERRH